MNSSSHDATINTDGKIIPASSRPAELADIFEQIDAMPDTAATAASAGQSNRSYDYDTQQIIDRAAKYVAERPASIQGKRGSQSLKGAALCVAWGFDLGADIATQILLTHFNPRCEPPWSEREIRRACERSIDGSADRQRGWLLAESRGGGGPHKAGLASGEGAAPAPGPAAIPTDIADAIGTAPPAALPPGPPDSGDSPPADNSNPGSHDDSDDAYAVGIDEDDPSLLASLFLKDRRGPEGLTLRTHVGSYCEFDGSCYVALSDKALRNQVVGHVERHLHARFEQRLRHHLAVAERGDSKSKLVPRKKVTRDLVSNTIQSIDSRIHIPDASMPPFWIDGIGPEPRELVAMKNGLVHLPSLAMGVEPLIPSTPRYFNLNVCGYNFSPTAPPPSKWFETLQTYWPNDPSSIDLLQEWCGYLITPDTSMQKILLMFGPTRTGKGTIARVIRGLVGELNIATPKLSSFGRNDRFEYEPLLGKTVAIIGDARMSGRTDQVAVAEVLLGISGEDPQDVGRKNKSTLSDVKLKTRFVILSNELPRLGDNSGAVIRRLEVLNFNRSFLGDEDLALGDQLMQELPGIFLWATEGWKRLKANRRFTKPESSAELIEEAHELASPVKKFGDEYFIAAPNGMVDCGDAYRLWVHHCKQSGHRPESIETFGRNLSAAFSPRIKRVKRGTRINRVYKYTGIAITDEAKEILNAIQKAEEVERKRASAAAAMNDVGSKYIPD